MRRRWRLVGNEDAPNYWFWSELNGAFTTWPMPLAALDAIGQLQSERQTAPLDKPAVNVLVGWLKRSAFWSDEFPPVLMEVVD